MTLRIELVPITLTDAHLFVRRVHRHHPPAQGGLFAVAVAFGESVVGVAVVGRPVARLSADGYTAEVTRLATDGTPNACSMLYRAAWRACRALGYRRLVTYTLATEPGASLRGAGFREIGCTGGGSWSRDDRPRVDRHPTQEKIRWEVAVSLLLTLALLIALPAHAGRLTGTVSLKASMVPDLCDTLRQNVAGVPHMVHGRIMRGETHVWQDSVMALSGSQFVMYYPELSPGTYQALSWTTRPNMAITSCPEAIAWTVEPRYKIIFGWTTVGAVWDNSTGRVIGAAEMMKRLNACESGGP